MISKKIKYIIILLIFVSLVLISSSFAIYSFIIDRDTYIVIGNQIVSKNEVEEQVVFYKKRFESFGISFQGEEGKSKLEKIKAMVLNKIIEDKLIILKAKELGITIDQKEIDEAINKFIKEFSSREKYLNSLQNLGLTEIGYKKMLTNALLRKKVLEKVVGVITATPEEVKEYYFEKNNIQGPPTTEFNKWKTELEQKLKMEKEQELIKSLSDKYPTFYGKRWVKLVNDIIKSLF
ncbi:MAG: Chaperone SurA [candidate division WS2 bacterium]|nr:Chaperone SurA [Candidatus Lithacetigena glycinireducens]